MLILLLVLEGVLIWRFPNAGTYPFVEVEQPPTTAPLQDVVPDDVTGDVNGPPATTQDGELKNAVRVFDVVGSIAVPGGAGSDAYRETQQLIAQKSATGWDITLTTSNTKSADEVNRATMLLESDGSYYLTGFTASDAAGSFSCSGKMPGYLAVGKNSDTASMSCAFEGQGSVSPAIDFSGTAQAGAPVATQFNGKTYQARTLTISGAFTQGGSVTQALQFVAAPGIGELSYQGSLGDLVFSQLLGVVAGENSGTLVSMDNDRFFLP